VRQVRVPGLPLPAEYSSSTFSCIPSHLSGFLAWMNGAEGRFGGVLSGFLPVSDSQSPLAFFPA
jgi:hypothetical protein